MKSINRISSVLTQMRTDILRSKLRMYDLVLEVVLGYFQCFTFKMQVGTE